MVRKQRTDNLNATEISLLKPFPSQKVIFPKYVRFCITLKPSPSRYHFYFGRSTSSSDYASRIEFTFLRK